jgi:flagellar biogenesis protein FliO
MIKFWIIAILIFIALTYILSKFTLKENRKETGEKV